MTRDRIIAFLQQASFLIKKVHDAQEAVAQGQSVQDYLESSNKHADARKVAQEVAKLEGMRDEYLDAVTQKCRQPSVEDCEVLIEDIKQRLAIAEVAFSDWRRLLAEHDIASRGEYPTEERAAAEAQLTAAKQYYEAALTAAGDLVPSAGVVLL